MKSIVVAGTRGIGKSISDKNLLRQKKTPKPDTKQATNASGGRYNETTVSDSSL